MTYAFNEIERDSLAAQAPAPQKMRILVVAPSDATGVRMSAPMARETDVETTVIVGSLSDLVLAQDVDWTDCDFLVCHAGEDEADLLAAIHCLMARPGLHMHCVAMVDGPVEPGLEARLMAAGVSSVLPMPPCTAEAPTVAQMPDRRLHLSDPAAAIPETQTAAAPVAAAQSAPLGMPDLPAGNGTGKLTALLRARGGAGASTIAVNLGLTCAAAGGSVVVVDLDVQNGSVGVLLDIADSADMTTLLRDGALPDAAFLNRALVQHASGLDVLAAPDTFVPLSALSAEMVATLLDQLQARYDHVIVDMPQSMLDWVEPLFERASLALIVTDTSVPSIKRTRRLIDVLGEEHMTLAVQVVINKEKRPLLLSESQKEAARLLGRKLEHWIPEDARAARRALDSGVPVLTGAPRSGPARALAALGRTLFSNRSTERK